MPNTVSRYVRIFRFALRYRHAGIFRGVRGRRRPRPGEPERFVADLEELGPAFIKLGQALSGRADLVTPALLAALEKIQDDVDPVPVADVRRVIRDQLGQQPDTLFQRFDEQPLAAGSLAQVHAVTLHDGAQAVIKVQRPGVEDRIEEDLRILERLARWMQQYSDIGRRYGATQWIAQLRRSLGNELDFLAEAAYMRRFKRLLKPYACLHVPTVHERFCAHGVLTMERVQGEKIREDLPADTDEEVATEQARQLLLAYIDQVFRHGLVHVDPHPGNLLLSDDGRVVLLDFGMVTSIGPAMRRTLLKLLLYAAEGNSDQVRRLCEGLFTKLPEVDLAGYRRAVDDAVLGFAISQDEAGMQAGGLLLSLTSIGAEYGLRPTAELSLLGRALLNLEPAIRRLSPSLPTREIVVDALRKLVVDQTLAPLGSGEESAFALDGRQALLDAPEQLSQVLRLLSQNRLRFRIDGLEESHLIENLQKIANRIATGVIAAALFVAGSMLSHAGGGDRYTTLPLVMYAVGAVMSAGLLLSSLRRDRSPPE